MPGWQSRQAISVIAVNRTNVKHDVLIDISKAREFNKYTGTTMELWVHNSFRETLGVPTKLQIVLQ